MEADSRLNNDALKGEGTARFRDDCSETHVCGLCIKSHAMDLNKHQITLSNAYIKSHARAKGLYAFRLSACAKCRIM